MFRNKEEMMSADNKMKLIPGFESEHFLGGVSHDSLVRILYYRRSM